MNVTEDFLEFLEDGCLAIEVWGHRRSGFLELTQATGGTPVVGEEAEARARVKTFPER